jgi:hypothetical protein
VETAAIGCLPRGARPAFYSVTSIYNASIIPLRALWAGFPLQLLYFEMADAGRRGSETPPGLALSAAKE